MLAHYAARDLRPALIKALKWTFLVFYAAVVVLVLLNHWTGVLYTVTPDGGYIRSPANVILYHVALVIYVVLFISIVCACRNKRDRALYFVTYVLSIVIMLLQYLRPELPYYSMAFSLVLVCIAMTKEYQQRAQRRRAREPRQDDLPQQNVARYLHARERHHRLYGAGFDVCGRSRGGARLSLQNFDLGPASAHPHQRCSGHEPHRERAGEDRGEGGPPDRRDARSAHHRQREYHLKEYRVSHRRSGYRE